MRALKFAATWTVTALIAAGCVAALAIKDDRVAGKIAGLAFLAAIVLGLLAWFLIDEKRAELGVNASAEPPWRPWFARVGFWIAMLALAYGAGWEIVGLFGLSRSAPGGIFLILVFMAGVLFCTRDRQK